MTDKTIWRQAADYIREQGWGAGSAKNSVTGCYCAGGAIAQAVTGDPDDMYEDFKLPDLELALMKFANHVDAPYANDEDDFTYDFPSERVASWNDRLPVDTAKDTVLKALDELDKAEVASTT